MGAESEAVLRDLCAESFLSLWSIPNPHTDDGLEKRGEGKELCDLLVVFGDDVIIFSDKSCAMSAKSPPTDKPSLYWDRWYRKAVSHSVEQVFGAERWLKNFPGRIFSDSRCEVPLEVMLPPPGRARFHRIVVALGAGDACRNVYGGSGSLMISGGGGAGLWQPPPNEEFTVGREGDGRGFVHVFDEVTLQIVLSELDTIVDFVEYLVKKEGLFASRLVLAAGEEDLLGWYLLNAHKFLDGRSEGGGGGLMVEEGQYEALTKLPQYHSGKRANWDSYHWDRLIEHFILRWRQGRLVQGQLTSADVERALRIMAGTSRLQRRQLGEMAKRVALDDSGRLRMAALMGAEDATTAFAAIRVPFPRGSSSTEYQQLRFEMMLLYARSLKVRKRDLKQALVVGFGRSPGEMYSEDLLVADLIDWSDEIEDVTRTDMKTFGIGAAATPFVDFEFPIEGGTKSRAQLRRQRQIERGMLKPDGVG